VISINKKILIPTIGLIAAIGLGALGVSAVKADETTTYPPIVQKIAEKFGLNESDVQSVFDQERQDRINQMQQAREQRLEQAVTDGVINEDQKQAIIDKWSEMQKERQQKEADLQKWFQDQGIDETKLAPYMGFGHHMGPGKMGFGMMKPS
jgi:hypothetical protein